MKLNKDIKISVLLGLIIILVVGLVTVPLFYNQYNSSMMLLKDKTIEDFKDEERIAQIFISSRLKISNNKLSEYVNNSDLIKKLESQNSKEVKKIIEKGVHENLNSDFLFLTYNGSKKITDVSLNILDSKNIIQNFINKTSNIEKNEIFVTNKKNVIFFINEDIISRRTGKVLATLHSGYIVNSKSEFSTGLSQKINNHNAYFFIGNTLISGTKKINQTDIDAISHADNNLIQVKDKLFYIGKIEFNDKIKLKVVFETSSNYIKHLKDSYISNFMITVLVSIILCLITMLFANKLITPPLEKLLDTINLLIIRNIHSPSNKGIIREFNLIEDNFIEVFNKFQQKKSQLAKFINSSPTSVLIIDYSGHIIQSNEAATELFNISNNNGNILLDSALTDCTQFKNILNSLKDRSNSFTEELNFKVLKNWKNTTWTFIQDKKEDYIFIQCIDNTEKVEAQAQIEAERSKSIHNQKLAAIGEIAGSIAHEINNPMGIISLSLSILENEMTFVNIENSDKKKNIESTISNIENAVNRTSQIITNLLDFSREGSKDKLESKNLNSILSKTLIFIEEKMKKAKIKLDITQLDTSIHILAKETQFSQVLVNLINNSTDALTGHEERVIFISTEIREDVCIIHFKDTGPGIPTEIEKQVFSAFYTTKLKGSGTGLGLSISKELMVEMSGDLQLVRSKKGAHFEVSIPLAKS